MRATGFSAALAVYLRLATATYFTMSNMKMTLPASRTSLETAHPLLTTLRAVGDVRYAVIESTENLLLVNSTSGELILNKGILENQDVKGVSANISATKGNDTAWTTFEIDVLPTEARDCDLITQDLCFWHSVSYRIYENSEPNLIGSLASPYLLQTCEGYDLNYTLVKGQNNVELIPPEAPFDTWNIRTARTFDRDIVDTDNATRPDLINVIVECKVQTPRGEIRTVSKDFNVHVLDVDDNAPQSQEPELSIRLKSNFVLKDSPVEHGLFIFHDRDSPEVNDYDIRVLDDRLGILRPECNKYENDLYGTPQTALTCKLIFTESKQLPDPAYSVVVQVNDTSLKGGTREKAARLPVHLYTSFKGGLTSQDLNRPLLLYPQRTVQVFRTAAPYARVAQPTPELAKNATGFAIAEDPSHNGAFRVTGDEGIIYVNNTKLLVKSGSSVRLNVQWRKNGVKESDEISVNVINEPTPTCTALMGKQRWERWNHCSSNTNKRKCEATCGVSTGGAPNVLKRRQGGLQRCMWHGDEVPGKQVSSVYSTCTPDSATCPDGVCDSLEQMNPLVCPQDCTERVVFPTSLNPHTHRGILYAAGVCYCDETTNCQCDSFEHLETTKRPSADRKNASGYRQPSAVKSEQIYPVSPEPPLENADICGTACMLSIAAGALFLVAAVAVTVACWRLDKVHKVVRGKFSEDTQDLSAPLSDYVDRGVVLDNLQLSFDMTTTIGDSSSKNAPDPKWEFPRSQLIIEQTLGEGEFGRVLRARAQNIAGRSGFTTVAVKTLKEDARESELADLLSEYQLLKDVNHTNIIKLLGACTVPGGPVYLIIEFAQYGSLRNYLRRSRHLKSENACLPSSDVLDDSNPVPEHYDEPNVAKVTPREILSFAWQICNGMAYLTDIKLVHRDLAARNVLLAEGKVCKISDFGLTRDIYEDDAYYKRSKGRVPVKWMAPESLSDHVYTSKSDVWSFGIVVWELVTLGATPYPGIAVHNLFHLLKTGYRMERPENCSQELYKVMRSCWAINPDDRPAFQDLASQWEKMLADQVDYLDLANNAIHNRSYFCSPLGETPDEPTEEPKDVNQLNYLNRSQSYVKCGETDKMLENGEVGEEVAAGTSNNNNNNVKVQGYETPVKIRKVKTPTNESPQYYTDMALGSRKQS